MFLGAPKGTEIVDRILPYTFQEGEEIVISGKPYKVVKRYSHNLLCKSVTGYGCLESFCLGDLVIAGLAPQWDPFLYGGADPRHTHPLLQSDK